MMPHDGAPAVRADTGTAVYTFGWDTAFAIPVAEVNRTIVGHKSSPANFSFVEETYAVSGEFGDWQICPGGDGKNVRLRLPLKNVKLTYLSTKKVLIYADGVAIVEVQLHFIPHTGVGASTRAEDGQPFALVVRPTAPSATVPAFTIVEMSLNPTPGTVSHALVQQGLADWGNAHLAEFSHVFSVVNLNRQVDQGSWGFVTPHYTSYAYLDRDSTEHSLFAVLCMTGDRTGDRLAEQISQAAIPPGSAAGFLISPARTLHDVVRPAITLAYPGLTEQNFLMNEDATELYLKKDTTVDLKPIQKDGHTYYPKLTQLSVKSNGQILTLTSLTTTDVAPGITATCQSTHWYTIVLGTSENGQTLVFRESQPPSIVHDIHQSEGSIITEIVIALVAALALLILIVLTEGAALIVGGLVIGLVMGADTMVPALIEKVNHDDAPSIDLLLVNAVQPIRWTSSSTFKLDYASLNVSLQLGGDPRFV